ncbi:hypothetical protein L6452_21972 [Arctium lappa]|uniref:Uncharacterized protein n=1 Tax=Arctium lappa TaxID=4217 RepID=A0ACB9AY47_ARCLA|nr:hypothetical protein L6452_21972 [Arctium lappa]
MISKLLEGITFLVLVVYQSTPLWFAFCFGSVKCSWDGEMELSEREARERGGKVKQGTLAGRLKLKPKLFGLARQREPELFN